MLECMHLDILLERQVLLNCNDPTVGFEEPLLHVASGYINHVSEASTDTVEGVQYAQGGVQENIVNKNSDQNSCDQSM